mmetsp:Transcript_42290/g.72853  ORF Transcript_42290/g.72853 Transcript_42290/m.72853 type:complete len:187 (+) Transcript_42290:101-661(+)|eukprot:CAMPEP_0194565234 /NCGR_PEP_ID=MMETSP0292-20121207/4573_1 /TAXON_ID=39354 /ORGANISM="Heterosigma akashiwo, Strain CCMP2393" /LENGTH=186 /DNA_ID=CAMNT_0039414527 /DNA_START=82 /DNA_END=642 /DNA_ORIENTATION=-
MAFFGLTSLGPQDSFASSAIDQVNLNIFTDNDFEASFRKFDRDQSGFIERDEIQALLEDVYRGPCRQVEVDMFLMKFDQNYDGKISWDEFRSTLETIRAELEEREQQRENGVGIGSEFKSNQDFHASLRKHQRMDRNPNQKYHTPLTATQEIGFKNEEFQPEPRAAKKSCEETLYAAELVKAGVYY